MSWSEFRVAASALCLVVTTGCGFQLQTTGEYPQAMSVTYLEAADEFTVFYRKLSAALLNGGVRVTKVPGEATAVVRILHDETGQRILSVSPRNVPEEYDVYYIVRYSVSIKGKEVLPQQSLVQTKDYAYDETEVLGKASEEQILREAIADDFVRSVTRQLAMLNDESPD
jgi:LPS-assembly lipoprotein